MIGTTPIPADVLAVLEAAEPDGDLIRLTGDPLDRQLYVKVDRVLTRAGGKWDRKRGGHAFGMLGVPAAFVLDRLLLDGTVTDARRTAGFFPTPPAVVARLLDLAEPLGGTTLLEPSAGDGAIAHAAVSRGAVVEAVELDLARADTIRGAGLVRHVTAADFLTVRELDTGMFDRVVMNPPFAGQADIAHVRHALAFLRPGGLLVSVMSAGTLFRTNKAASDFRDLIIAMGGRMEPLPAKSFTSAGTGTGTLVAVVPVGPLTIPEREVPDA